MQTNPNKANQHKPDPRQAVFLSYYLDRDSETFANALQSGIKAGFSEKYSENLTSQLPTWLREKLGDESIICQAEKNLKNFLSDAEDDKKIKSDMTKFALKGLAKQKYSERIENEIKGDININVVNYKNGDNNTPQIPTEKISA